MCIHILHRVTIKGYSVLKFSEVAVSVSSTLQTATLIERNIVTMEIWKNVAQESKLFGAGFCCF